MSIEVNPVGVTCNLSCPYCYEHPQRDAGNFTKVKNMDAIKSSLEKEGGQFSVFGGEPLLTKIEDLEELWAWGLEKHGQNGIQTNGTLITPEHIELFRKYNVHVGMSMDGPDELNDSRWRNTIEETREATKKSMDNLDTLLRTPDITCSLIMTLYQGNVRNGRFKKFKKWIRELDQKGLQSARIHLLEVDHKEVEEEMKLTDEENIECLIELHDLEKELDNLSFDIFKDLRRLLLGKDQQTTCVWNACDPYTTSAVRGIDANGDRHNCGRTNKDGVNWFKSNQKGYERQLSLYHTPWENNGCKGCRFFLFCKGECPGTGEQKDWRNKTDQCWVWYKLFEHVEQDLIDQGKQPISLRHDLNEFEKVMLRQWAMGNNINIATVKKHLDSRKGERVLRGSLTGNQHGDDHGDHYDHSGKQHGDDHGDKPHGDHSDQG